LKFCKAFHTNAINATPAVDTPKVVAVSVIIFIFEICCEGCESPTADKPNQGKNLKDNLLCGRAFTGFTQTNQTTRTNI
jgi:hypothetical protein